MEDISFNIIKQLKNVTGSKYLITDSWNKNIYSKGWRYGEGEALAVAIPGSLIQLWDILNICVSNDVIVIMQAANTGLTGGSTPYGNDYDRPLIIINTMRINDIQLINNGKQVIAFSGSTLFDLEKSDIALGNHRSHGHYLAKRGNLDKLVFEVFGDTRGCCKGFGGSMHMLDRSMLPRMM